MLRALQKLTELGGFDLSLVAEHGQVSRAYSRDDETNALLAQLTQRKSVLLIGPHGVGKSALIGEVANRIAHGRAPEPLQGCRLVRLAVSKLDRSAVESESWRSRLQRAIDAFTSADGLVWILDEIWRLRVAGGQSGAGESFAAYLRPYLEAKTLTILGEATDELLHQPGPQENAPALVDDPTFLNLFDAIRLNEPEEAATRKILSSVALDLERRNGVEIGPPMIDRAIALTRRFQPDNAMPGKAIGLMQRAVQDHMDQQKHHPPSNRSSAVIANGVTTSFAALTGLPEKLFSDRVPLDPSETQAYFAERVIGQDDAVSAVVDLVTLVKAELQDPMRPLGVLLFVGPTGSGKTMLAKTLAEYLFGSAQRLVRLDMTHFRGPEGAVNLAGALVQRLQAETFCVLLLDEIEKASAAVLDLLGHAFDEGMLNDPWGRSAYLRNTIVIMTCNLTVGTSGSPLGFSLGDSRKPEEWARRSRAVEAYFQPEFVNRLDRIALFRPLDAAAMRRIAQRELGRALLREGVTRRNILLDFRAEVLDVLLEAAFGETFGAPSLQRAIQELILLPLARRIAAQPDLLDQLLEFRVVQGRVEIEVIPVGAPVSQAPEPEVFANPSLETSAEVELAFAEPAAAPVARKDLRQLSESIAELQQRLSGLMESEPYQALQDRSRLLLEQTLQPSFWDDQTSARATLSSLYHLERLTDQFTSLRSRAEALAEIPELIRRHRDRNGAWHLDPKVRDLEQEVEFAQLELLANDPDQVASNGAFIRIRVPEDQGASQGEEWQKTLQSIYTQWALRKQYEVETIREDKGQVVLLVRGSNIARILASEGGLHRYQTSEPGAGKRKAGVRVQMASVEILPMERDKVPPAFEPFHPTATGSAALQAPSELVRVYHAGRQQSVRDPRTGQHVARLREVTGGAIDSFLLAYLKQHQESTLDNLRGNRE